MTSPYFFSPSELRARFNPDGSSLRRQQLRMKEMLAHFDAICRKHNIPYWISSGTLLGCVRHGGFIPWDDDLDIEMLRPDYLRLLRILPAELPSWMALQTRRTDPHYFYSYAKLRDKQSQLSETNAYDRIFRLRGIYIDIFPQEKIPLWLQRLSCHTIGHVYARLNKSGITLSQAQKAADGWYRLNHYIIYPLMRLVALLYPSQLVRHTYGVPFHTACHLKEVFPLGRAKFEDIEVSVPHDSDAYLKRKYGDYLRLPNLSHIAIHTANIQFNDK